MILISPTTAGLKRLRLLLGLSPSLVGDQDSGLTKLVTEKIQSDAQKAVGVIVNDTDINDVPVRSRTVIGS